MFDKNKNKIIVTGGSGFVGTHTVKALREKGYKVLNFDLKEYLDVRNEYLLNHLIEKGDKVLHLAAIARFAQADEDPLLAYEINVGGTKNVAKTCWWNSAERLVYSSTGSVYMPISKEPPITEEFEAKGNSVYGCSKYAGECYVRKEQTPWIILRYAHLYGEGKIGHGLVGGFLDRINRGLAPILYNGIQSNDFTYIKDIVQANILALEAPKKVLNQIYNIGTGEELSAEKAGEIVCEAFGWPKEKVEKKLGRTVDALRFVFDTSKAKKLLKFKAQYSFKEGLLDMANVLGYNQSNDKTTKKRLLKNLERKK